ncbi:pectate lyase-like protein [Bacillus oleivorans]|uniref:Pectate lyase-like protein n=1 Tax=Bacillus oleivorans TaxID=1448271 RepID=A0A285D656_9BACI|nr:glycosyl hydrolase family 28-related protein [Bacillus oleivorans]SNX75314.1 pectate lyase-like protein [Bacillus oleivorans]
MALTKQGEFTKKVTDLPDTPSPDYTPTEIKTYFQTPADELKTTLNKLIDDLVANTGAGQLGAKDEIGATTTIQAMLDKLKNKTDRTGNHQGTWQGLTPSGIGSETINGSRLDIVEGEHVNVKRFGAKGDEVTDDTQAIKDAIAHANANNLNVYIPKGVYKVTSTITLPTGVNLIGAGGWTQRTTIAQVGDFNLFEMVGGYSGGKIEGIHITGFGTNGATNTAIYVKRSGVALYDISIQSYKGTAINMDGSISLGTGSWFSKLDRIKIVGFVENGVYYTNRGIILGENFNSSFLTNFTIHYCKVALETKVVNNILVSKGNISENKDVDSFGVKMTDAGTNVKLSDIHFEGNKNGIQISKGNIVILDNLISNGYSIQDVFIDIPAGSIAQNVSIQNCRSFGSSVADVRADGYKTYKLNVINCSLTSATPILNLNNSEIVITSNGVTTKDPGSLEPLQLDKSVVLTADTTLLKNQTNTRILCNSGTVINLTLPAYLTGLRYTIINTRTSGTVNIASAQFQNFGAETGLITNQLQIFGLGLIEVFSSADRWIVLNQRGAWTKI